MTIYLHGSGVDPSQWKPDAGSDIDLLIVTASPSRETLDHIAQRLVGIVQHPWHVAVQMYAGPVATEHQKNRWLRTLRVQANVVQSAAMLSPAARFSLWLRAQRLLGPPDAAIEAPPSLTRRDRRFLARDLLLVARAIARDQAPCWSWTDHAIPRRVLRWVPVQSEPERRKLARYVSSLLACWNVLLALDPRPGAQALSTALSTLPAAEDRPGAFLQEVEALLHSEKKTCE